MVFAFFSEVGQGANQAIEDAVVLADCLGAHKHDMSCEKALLEYYGRRYPRTKKVVDSSRYFGKFMHTEGGVTGWLCDRILKALLKDNAEGQNLFLKIAEREIIDGCPVPFTPKPMKMPS